MLYNLKVNGIIVPYSNILIFQWYDNWIHHRELPSVGMKLMVRSDLCLELLMKTEMSCV